MISDLLAVGRLEEGMRAQRSDADVAALVAEVAGAHAAQAGRAGVALSVAVAAGLRASIDPGLARRLLENLAGNALRHLDTGDRLELAAELDGERLRLAVRNSGPEVPAALREKIFEKDVSGAGADWSHAGLGLYFCSLAAAAHGGGITLAERPGWNVSFEVELCEARPRLAGPRAIGVVGPGA
jgi:signal transduction histidine kinase